MNEAVVQRGVEGAPHRALDALIAHFAHLINSHAALLCQPAATAGATGGQGLPPTIVCSWGIGDLQDQIVQPLDGGFVGRALQCQRAAFEPLDRGNGSKRAVAESGTRLTHAVIAPLRAPAGPAGALIAGFTAPPDDPEWTLWAAETHAGLFALGLHRPELLEEMIGNSRHDALTGCLTYASVVHELDREINRCSRSGLALSCFFVDLDGFKRVNDEQGHVRGNQVLAALGPVLRGGVRNCDTVGRYGGDEFVAILPQTAEHEALALAHRLRELIASQSITAFGRSITASIGVAEWTPGTGSEDLIAKADRALLLAKARGGGVTVDGRPEAAGLLG